jgi:hypothetical protein
MSTSTRNGQCCTYRDALALPAQHDEVLEHFLRMGVDVGDLVDPGHLASAIDQVGDPLGKVRILLVGPTLGAVGSADGPVNVAEERESKTLGVGENLVVGRCVKTRPEALSPGSGKLLASITEALSLPSSAGGRRLGIPPQDDPRPTQIAQSDRAVLYVRKDELRRF